MSPFSYNSTTVTNGSRRLENHRSFNRPSHIILLSSRYVKSRTRRGKVIIMQYLKRGPFLPSFPVRQKASAPLSKGRYESHCAHEFFWGEWASSIPANASTQRGKRNKTEVLWRATRATTTTAMHEQNGHAHVRTQEVGRQRREKSSPSFLFFFASISILALAFSFPPFSLLFYPLCAKASHPPPIREIGLGLHYLALETR